MPVSIVALRNEKGSYNMPQYKWQMLIIVALRNEKGSYNRLPLACHFCLIVALRNEKGSYNVQTGAERAPPPYIRFEIDGFCVLFSLISLYLSSSIITHGKGRLNIFRRPRIHPQIENIKYPDNPKYLLRHLGLRQWR